MPQTMSLRLDVPTTNSLRGISILIIVVFHVLLYFDISPVFNLPGSVAVAAFLFLSGYGINESWKKKGLSGYWRKKFRRVIVPYYLFLIILTAIQGTFRWRDFLLDITFVHSSFWFVEYLVRCYLVFWIARRFFPRHVSAVFIIFGLLSLNCFMQIEAEQSFSFFCGLLVSEHINKVGQADRKCYLRVFMICFAVGAFFYLFKALPVIHQFKGTLGYNYILLLIKLPLAVCLILLPSFFRSMSSWKAVRVCGKCSLELYLVHLPLIDLIHYSAEGLAVYVLLTVVLTVLFYQFDTKVMPYIIR